MTASAIAAAEAVVVPGTLRRLAAALGSRSYQPVVDDGPETAHADCSAEGIGRVCLEIVQAGLVRLLSEEVGPEAPCGRESEAVAAWLAGLIEAGLTRVCSETIDDRLDAAADDRVLAAARARIEDADVLQLLTGVLGASKSTESRHLLQPLLLDLYCAARRRLVTGPRHRPPRRTFSRRSRP